MRDLRDIPGVPESRLTDAAAARLPGSRVPAPWTTRLEAVVWVHGAAPRAHEHLPPELRDRRALPLTIGAFVRYLDTPVGPYDEVLGSPVLLARAPMPAAVVPFIAVDDAASVVGGRANWALPKVFARFERSADFRSRSAEGEDAAVAWAVRAAVRARPRALPIALRLSARQPPPGGRIPIALAGRAQLASVDVRVDGDGLATWLRPGRHPGLVLTGARATFGAPRS